MRFFILFVSPNFGRVHTLYYILNRSEVRHMSSYFVIGGDERMAHLKSLLQKKHIVTTACMEEIDNQSLSDNELIIDALHKTNNVVLPIPYSKDSIHIFAPFSNKKLRYKDVFDHLSANQNVFYGNAEKPDMIETLARKINFLDNEKYAYVNARLTSEITFGLLIAKYKFSPYRKNILICGYGRIAKTLSSMLQGLNAHVTIAARKDTDINLAIALGLAAVNIADISRHMSRFDCVVNTIPKCVIAAPELKALKDDALLIDIASKPYGVDFETAKALKKNVFIEQGLPGKYMPALEAEALTRIISAY